MLSTIIHKFRNSPVLILVCYSLVLVLIFLFHINSNSPVVPTWDEAHHLKMGFYFLNALEGPNHGLIRTLLINSGQIYPPFFHILIAVYSYFFGTGIKAGQFVNVQFIVLLIFSTYALGTQVFNRRAGLISALLIPITPLFLSLQESVLIDFASITLYILSFYLMFKTNGFANRKFSILFGICLFLSLVLKWPFVIPSLVFLWYAVDSFNSRRDNRSVIFTNLFLIVVLTVPAFAWYFYNQSYITNALKFFWDPAGYPQVMWKNPNLFSIENISLYAVKYPIGTYGIGLIPLLLFVKSLFIKKINFPKIKYLLGAIVITYFVLTYLNDKAEKYIGYIYPLVIIYTVGSLDHIKDRFSKKWLLLFLTVSVFANFIIALVYFPNTKSVTVSNLVILPGYFSPYAAGEWYMEKIIYENIKSDTCKNGLFVLPDHPNINPVNISYYLLIRNNPTPVLAAYDFFNPIDDSTFNLNHLEYFDCIITKDGYPGIFVNRKAIEETNQFLAGNTRFFESKFESPDGSEIKLYIRKK